MNAIYLLSGDYAFPKLSPSLSLLKLFPPISPRVSPRLRYCDFSLPACFPRDAVVVETDPVHSNFVLKHAILFLGGRQEQSWILGHVLIPHMPQPICGISFGNFFVHFSSFIKRHFFVPTCQQLALRALTASYSEVVPYLDHLEAWCPVPVAQRGGSIETSHFHRWPCNFDTVFHGNFNPFSVVYRFFSHSHFFFGNEIVTICWPDPVWAR